MSTPVYHSRPRDDIAERIECYIIEHGLQPGDRLPSERSLCEAWDCNRMTFRAATRRLVAEGKLCNEPGVGNYVAPEKLERYLQDLTSFSDFVMQKGQRIANRIIDRYTRPAGRHLAQALKVPEGSQVMELVRLRLVDDEPILLETAHIPLQRFEGIDIYDFERLSLYSVMQRKYSTVIRGGREEISITYADAREAELLQVDEGAVLFYLKGVTWDENEEPIELVKSVSRTDRLSFAGTLQKE